MKELNFKNMNNIEICNGSNPLVNHYSLEHKLFKIFKWRTTIKKGEIMDKTFLIEFRIFKKRFRYEKTWRESYLGVGKDSNYKYVTFNK